MGGVRDGARRVLWNRGVGGANKYYGGKEMGEASTIIYIRDEPIIRAFPYGFVVFFFVFFLPFLAYNI